MNEILTSIKRTPYQSTASFLILFFTLFLALFLFTMTTFFNGILSFVETKPQVTVYFKNETKEQAIGSIRSQLMASTQIAQVKYTSKQEALKIYRDLNKNNPLLLEMVSADILPASLEIYARQASDLPVIADQLHKLQGVDEVVFQRDVVDKLVTLTTSLRRASIFLLVFLVVVVFIVLMTTTAFKIALKKDEIELMRLLGASHGYVRWPFLKEGMFFGFVSGTAAFTIYYLLVFILQPFMQSYLSGIPQLEFMGLGSYGLFVWPPSLLFVLLSYILIVVLGMGIGYFGNYLSTSKYIK